MREIIKPKFKNMGLKLGCLAIYMSFAPLKKSNEKNSNELEER